MKRKFALILMATLMLSGCGSAKTDEQLAQTFTEGENECGKRHERFKRHSSIRIRA